MALAGKKAQMHLPMEMIFSMLIIAIFLVVVFFVIQHFLEVQECAQIGLFVRELQTSVDEVWKAQEASTEFEAELPSSIKYICFINLSQDKHLAGLNTEEKETASRIYYDLQVYFKFKNVNLFFYPIKAACNMPAHNIKNINLGNLNNPYCIHLSKIRIKLTKGFDESLVRITSVSEVPAKEQEKKVMEKEEYEEQSIDLSVSTKESLSISQGESVTIKVEKEHKLKLEEAALESAAIFLDSTHIRIKVNETKMVDLNRNGVADLAITLNNIQDNAATLVFEKLVEDECAECIAACSKSFTSLPPIIKDLVIVFAPSASECLTRCQDKGLCEKTEVTEAPSKPPSEPELKTQVCEGTRFKCCDKFLYALHGVIDPPPPKGQMPPFSECKEWYWTDCSASPSCESVPLFTYPLVSQPVILESQKCNYPC